MATASAKMWTVAVCVAPASSTGVLTKSTSCLRGRGSGAASEMLLVGAAKTSVASEAATAPTLRVVISKEASSAPRLRPLSALLAARALGGRGLTSTSNEEYEYPSPNQKAGATLALR